MDTSNSQIRNAWGVAAKGPVFLVTNGAEYLVEGPEEQWGGFDPESDEPAETSVLRVFSDYEHAVLYCELQRENYVATEEEMQVVRTTLDQLFGLIGVIDRNSVAEWDVHVRIDFSVMPTEDEEPKSIDTLYAPNLTIH
jgi:hypothetical protein